MFKNFTLTLEYVNGELNLNSEELTGKEITDFICGLAKRFETEKMKLEAMIVSGGGLQ